MIAPDTLYGTNPDSGPGLFVVYDLSAPETWTRTGEERRAWGRESTDVFTLDSDHSVIAFRPGRPRSSSE